MYVRCRTHSQTFCVAVDQDSRRLVETLSGWAHALTPVICRSSGSRCVAIDKVQLTYWPSISVDVIIIIYLFIYYTRR